ncbi:MAG: phage tail tape measure protein, partial [Actinobacteria bacterium]|nr:phage tail tape measure protein [Actinomycetota bacterium]
LNGNEAVRVADLLTAASSATLATVPQMGDALKQAAASAHAMHVPLQDTVTMISEMAHAGITGSDAGTSLKTMFQRLNPTTKTAAAAVKELGVHAFNAQGQFVGMRSIIGQYHDALAKLHPQQRQSAINTIFGTDAMRAANIIMGTGAGAFDRMKKAVTEHGAAQKMAEAQTRGWAGAVGAFKSELETLAITFGTRLLPAATQAVSWITVHLPAAARVVSSAVSDISGPARAMGDALGSAFGWLGKNTDVLKSAGVAALALAAALGVAATAQIALSVAEAANPIGLVIIAIAALAGGLALLYQRSETARQIMNAAWSDIQTGARVAMTAVTAAIGAGVSLIRAHWGQVQAATSQAWTAVRGYVNQFLAWYRANVAPAVSAVAGFIEAHWGRIKQAFQVGVAAVGVALDIFATVTATAVRTAMATLRNFVSVFEGVMKLVSGILTGDWGRAWAGAKQVVLALVSEVGAILHGFVSTVTGVMRALAPAVKGAAHAVASAAYDVGQGILSGIVGQIKSLGSKVATFVGEIPGWITGEVGVVASAAASIGSAIYNGIMGALSGLGSAIAGIIRNAIAAAMGPVQALLDKIASIGGGGGGGKSGKSTKGLTGAVADAVKQMSDGVIAAIRTAKQNLQTLTGTLSSQLDAIIDKQTRARIDANDQSPAAQELRAIEAAQKATADARDRARLDAAVASAQTDDERKQAQQDLDDYLLEQHRQALADQVAATAAAIQAEADKRKADADQAIADLTDQFNRGKISAEQFKAQLEAIIGPATGAELGKAFANAFAAQLQAIIDQINQIAAAAGAKSGVGNPTPDTTDPGATAGQEAKDAASKAMDEWTAKRAAVKDAADQAAAAVKSAQQDYADAVGYAKSVRSPGGAKITKDEESRIASLSQAIAQAKYIAGQRAADLAAWDKEKGHAKPHAAGGVAMSRIFTADGSDVAGERGREAILPLDDPRSVRLLRKALGGGGVTVHQHFHGQDHGNPSALQAKAAFQLRQLAVR